MKRSKLPSEIRPEEVETAAGIYGDLNVLHSKRTGLATGHTPTTVEGAKRINWVRAYARTHHMTPSKVVRILANEAIDRQMKTGKR